MPFTLFLLYAVAAVSFAAVAFDAAPARVLALYPANAPALSTLARDSLLEADGPRASRRHALQSLRQGPVGPDALRTLALISELDNARPRAAALMSGAFALNRRDLGVSMWLIEEHLRRNDIPGALRHYDIALRTSRRAQGVLFPVLIKAAEEEALLPQLAGMIGQGAAWGDSFGDALVRSDIDPRAKVALANELNGKPWFGRPFREKLVANLVANEEFALAASVAGRSGGYDRRLAAALDLPVGGGPFDWNLANGYQVETAVEGRNGRSSLYVRMSPEFRDSPARLLMTLPRGSYRLSSRLTDAVPTIRTRWEVACAQSGGAVLAELQVGSARTETNFVIPANCEAQRLSLRISNAATTSDDLQVEIGELSVARIDGF